MYNILEEELWRALYLIEKCLFNVTELKRLTSPFQCRSLLQHHKKFFSVKAPEVHQANNLWKMLLMNGLSISTAIECYFPIKWEHSSQDPNRASIWNCFPAWKAHWHWTSQLKIGKLCTPSIPQLGTMQEDSMAETWTPEKPEKDASSFPSLAENRTNRRTAVLTAQLNLHDQHSSYLICYVKKNKPDPFGIELYSLIFPFALYLQTQNYLKHGY